MNTEASYWQMWVLTFGRMIHVTCMTTRLGPFISLYHDGNYATKSEVVEGVVDTFEMDLKRCRSTFI